MSAPNGDSVPDKKMSATEREQLAAKLDKDLDDFIGGLAKKPYQDTWTEENWQDEMEKHPFFRTKPFEDGEELPPLIQGIQEIKYSCEMNTDDELAITYKEDGNRCFRAGKYRFAVANYTEALDRRPSDTLLLTQLLSNRAAAHYHLENYRSCRRDCERALALTPDHCRALERLVLCSRRVGRPDDALLWCDRALAACDRGGDAQWENRLLKARAEIEKEQARVRKEARERALQEEEARRLARAVASRGVRVSRGDGFVLEASVSALLDDPSLLTPELPVAQRGVHLSDDGQLVWPLLLIYPESDQTDFLHAVEEGVSLADVVATVLEEPAMWDEGVRYTPQSVHIYYESCAGDGLVCVTSCDSLLSLLQRSDYVIKCGVPSVVLLEANSKFEREFIARNTRRS